MALIYIIFALTAFLIISLIVENHQLKRTIETKDKSYKVLRKACTQELNYVKQLKEDLISKETHLTNYQKYIVEKGGTYKKFI